VPPLDQTGYSSWQCHVHIRRHCYSVYAGMKQSFGHISSVRLEACDWLVGEHWHCWPTAMGQVHHAAYYPNQELDDLSDPSTVGTSYCQL
jgi:hypothetical protein